MTVYCTTLELKAWNTTTSAAQDDELDLVIESASAWIDAYCQRSFALSDLGPRRFAPMNTRFLRFGPFADLAELASVTTDVNGDGTFETPWVASDYELMPLNPSSYGPEPRPSTGIRAVNKAWPCTSGRMATVQVTGTWGWLEVPSAVRHACLIQASRIFLRRQSPQGVIGGFGEFGPVRVSGRVDPDVADLLRNYQHPDAAVLVA